MVEQGAAKAFRREDAAEEDAEVTAAAARQLPAMQEAAGHLRRFSWGRDNIRMEELEDSVLDLQAEVARLTEQVPFLNGTLCKFPTCFSDPSYGRSHHQISWL